MKFSNSRVLLKTFELVVDILRHKKIWMDMVVMVIIELKSPLL